MLHPRKSPAPLMLCPLDMISWGGRTNILFTPTLKKDLRADSLAKLNVLEGSSDLVAISFASHLHVLRIKALFLLRFNAGIAGVQYSLIFFKRMPHHNWNGTLDRWLPK